MTTPPRRGRRRGPGPDRVIVTDPLRLSDLCDVHPVSDRLLIALAERLAIIDTLARQPPRVATSADIAAQAQHCVRLLAAAFLQGAA